MSRLRDEKMIDDIRDELDRACARFPTFTSLHQGWAIIHEETEELWEEVRRWKGTTVGRLKLRRECIQIAAMAIRFTEDLLEEDESDA